MKPHDSFVYAVGMGAFISGIALVTVAVYLGGVLAALAIPQSYFDAFGGEHKKLALAIMEFVAMSLPCFLLSFVWCWLTLRNAVTRLKMVAWCCVTGIVIGLVYIEVQSAITLRTLESMSNPPSFISYLWRILAPVWAFPDLLAFPAGLFAAVWLVRRTRISRKGHPSITQPAV
jgi:hypothetical protein